VFIADSQAVRWRSVPRTSVAAGWDRTKLRWEWRDSKVGGLACVYHDGVAYRTSSGWCPTL